jgi:hypothetical protein
MKQPTTLRVYDRDLSLFKDFVKAANVSQEAKTSADLEPMGSSLDDSKSMDSTGDQLMEVVDNTNNIHEIVDSSPGDGVIVISKERPERLSKTDGGFLIKFLKCHKFSDLYPFAIRVKSSKLELLSLIKNENYLDKLASELTAFVTEKMSLDYVFRRGHINEPLLNHFCQTLKKNLPLLLVDMNYESDNAVWTLYVGAFRFNLTYQEGTEPKITPESTTVFEYSSA